jgi:transposase InsO family protein
LPSRSPHEYARCIPPTDAKNKGPCAPRSYGRSHVALYNGRRPHSSLDGTTPDQAYFKPLPLRSAA